MKNKTKKGSALVMVLIVLTILNILGVAMISLSTMSFKMRAFAKDITSYQYASESGLDEAYTIINKYCEAAVEKANIAVEEYLREENEKIDIERQIIDQFNYEKYNGLIRMEIIDTIEKYYTGDTFVEENVKYEKYDTGEFKYKNESGALESIEYINLDGNVKSDKRTQIENGKAEKFELAFEDYFNESNDDNISKLYEDLINEEYYNVLKEDEITGEDRNIIVESNSDKNFDDNVLNIILRSRFSKDEVEKSVQTTFQIITPNYFDISKIQDKYYNIYRNPVWEKAMCIDGNLEIKDGDVLFKNGDVYVKGRDNGEYRGVIISGTATGAVFQNSNLATANDIIYNSNVNSSRILAANNIYARNIKIENREGIEYGGYLYTGEYVQNKKVQSKDDNVYKGPFTGSVYLLDDMELNSEGSIVLIGEALYGLSDGSANFEADHSSSIIINADDLLNPDGDGDSFLKVDKEIYILGTSYINNLRYYGKPYKYQTGESISIKGKYAAYTQNVDSFPNVKFDYFDPLTLVSDNLDHVNESDKILATLKYYSYYDDNKNEYKTDTYITVDLIGDGIIENPDAVMYSINSGEKSTLGEPIVENNIKKDDKILVKIYKNINDTNPKEYKDIEVKYYQLSASDKSRYFKEYWENSGDSDVQRIRNKIQIPQISSEENKSYYTGAVYDPIWNTSNETWEIGINEGNIITNGLNYVSDTREKIIELKDEIFYLGKEKAKNIQESKVLLDDKPVNSVITEINFNSKAFNDNIKAEKAEFYNTDTLRNNHLVNCGGLDTIIFNNDDRKTLVIGEGNAIENKIRINTNDFKGIIITKGNIEIDQSIEYQGILICEGDVKITSGNPKFEYNKSNVENIITSNYKIFSGVFNQFGKHDKIVVEEYENVGSNKNKKEIIRLKNWFISK